MVCWLALQMLTACSNDNENNLPIPSAFFNDKVVEMIKTDYQTVESQGWSYLVLPRGIYSSMPSLQMSDDAKYVANRLHEAGFTVQLIGGTVRDYAMGTIPADFDFVTNATYEQCDSLFKPNFTMHQAGDNYFGGVQMPNEFIDLSHYCNVPKAYFGKVKMPADMKNGILSDSFERDLPFNALYFDPFTEEILDFHGGLYSIYTRTITTMVSPGEIELEVDPNVIIRAIRFAARYEFEIDDELDRIILNNGREFLKNYPRNIFFFNVVKLFNGGYAQRCSTLIERYNLWPFIIPSLAKSGSKDEYMDYLRKLMVEFDEAINLGAAGKLKEEQYVMAKLLLPRFKELCKTTSEDEACEQILTEQRETAQLNDDEQDLLTEYLKELK